jgi:hypothetical protein
VTGVADWIISPPRGLFNWQATLTLAGLVFVILSSFAGSPKKEEPGTADRIAPNLLAEAGQLRRELSELAAANAQLTARIDRLEADVARLRTRASTPVR